MIHENKNLCTFGDIYIKHGKYYICNVNYKRIAELTDKINKKKIKDKQYFNDRKELTKLMTDALNWEYI